MNANHSPGSLAAVTTALRDLRATEPGHVGERLAALSAAIRAAARPRDLIVLVLDRGGLAKAGDGERFDTLKGILAGLAREFPELEFCARRGPARPAAEAQ